MRTSWFIALAGGFALLSGAAFFAGTEESDDEQEQTIPLDKVPKPVIETVKAKFAQAELKAAETFKDDGKTCYEVELKHSGKSIDVVCTADGTILEIEKEVAVADLPAPVTQAINGKYPGAKITEAEEVTELADDDEDENGDDEGDDEGGEKDDDDELVYEVEITTADGKRLEVEVTPAGKVLEAEADDDSKDDDSETEGDDDP